MAKNKKPIFITSLREGFRRCGMAHPAEWVEHPAGTFTDEQVERLKNEPMLVVSDSADISIKTGDVARKEKTLNEREQALNEREAKIAEQEIALDEREVALDEREKALKK